MKITGKEGGGGGGGGPFVRMEHNLSRGLVIKLRR